MYTAILELRCLSKKIATSIELIINRMRINCANSIIILLVDYINWKCDSNIILWKIFCHRYQKRQLYV